MSKPTVIDFFCGAGGFSEGFRQQGFEIIKGVDHWIPAVQTFNHNFGLNDEPRNILDYWESIDLINDLPDSDVIIGSPPCVSFSNFQKYEWECIHFLHPEYCSYVCRIFKTTTTFVQIII